MTNFRFYDRSQRLLLPLDLNEWVANDDLAHFIVEACEQVSMHSFHVSRTGSGKAQYHPRMMLGLLVYCYASGIFPSRRIEQASYRNVSVRFIAANTHPDHDTIAKFRREVLRKTLEEDIGELLAKAEAADHTDSDDGLSLPDEIAHRQTLEAKLDAAAKAGQANQPHRSRQRHHAQVCAP